MTDTTTVVTTEADTTTEEVAEAVEELAEAVEELAEAVDDHSEVDAAVELALRLERIDNRLDELSMRPTGLTYDDVAPIVNEAVSNAIAAAAVVAEEVATEVAEEVADEEVEAGDDEDVEVTIVEPDVSENEQRESWWRRVW